MSSKKSLEQQLIDEQLAEAAIKHETAIQRERAQRLRAEKLAKIAVKERASEEDLLERLSLSIASLPASKKIKPYKAPVNVEHGLHTAIAHLSDLHVGEVVESSAMGGLSVFNRDVYLNRLGFWTDTLLQIIEIERHALDIQDLHIFMDGDMVTGEIHDELSKTNDLTITDATAMVAQSIAVALVRLSQSFRRIKVSATYGNHGRVLQKKEFKNRHVSWDRLAYNMMAMFTKDYPIDWEIPESHFAITQVLNNRWLHWHGDGIRGWAGFPWYGTDRAIKNFLQSLLRINETFDSVAMAHFHVPMMYQMPTGPLCVNGNWKGGDEYALGALNTNTDPIQNLYLISEKHGFIDHRMLYLADATEEDGNRMDGVLDLRHWFNFKERGE